MTRTEELMNLAEAAMVIDHNEHAEWYAAEYLERQGVYYPKNARFIAAAANPETIKQLVALCRLQHAALMQMEDYEVLPGEWDTAIAAFNKFEGGE